MFGLPLKTPHRVDLATPLREHLVKSLGEAEAARHEPALASFQALRDRLLLLHVANEGARDALKDYFVQLEPAARRFAGARLPPFAWGDTLSATGDTVSQSSWDYERACVLFSLAAVESGIAAVIDRRESPERAAQCKAGMLRASGYLAFLRDSLSSRLLGRMPADLQAQGLSLYIATLQAQAQVSLYEVARDKGMKQDVLAWVAAGAAELFCRAAEALPAGSVERDEADRCCPTVPWIAHAECQAKGWDAVGFFRTACVCSEKAEKTGEGHGERIAWLRAAELASGEALRVHDRTAATAKAININAAADRSRAATAAAAASSSSSSIFGSFGGKSAAATAAAAAAAAAAASTNATGGGSAAFVVCGDVDASLAQSVLDKARELLVEAVQDNTRIYMQLVPRLQDLPIVASQIIAKLPATAADQIGELTLARVGGREVFGAVTSPEAAAALRLLRERASLVASRDKERADKAAEEVRGTLAALSLPASILTGVGSSGVPGALWDRVARCQVEGGLPELERLFASNSGQARVASECLRLAESVQAEEAQADLRYRTEYGARWGVLSSEAAARELREDLERFTRLAATALASDARLRAKLDGARPQMALLSCQRAELDETVPAGYAAPASAASGGIDDEVEHLRQLLSRQLEEINQLLFVRGAAMEELREAVDLERSAESLAHLPSAELGPAADALLAAPSLARSRFEDSLAQQARLLDALGVAHGRYCELRRLDDRSRARERAIQVISEACDSFDEVRSILKDGANFWLEFRGRTESLLSTSRDFASARSFQQREQLLLMQQRQQAQPQAPAQTQPQAPWQQAPSSQPQWQPQSQFQPQQQWQHAPPQPWQQQHQQQPPPVVAPLLFPPRPLSVSLPPASTSPYSPGLAPAQGGSGSGAAPPSAATQHLCAMGFAVERVQQALAANNNDFDLALASLLAPASPRPQSHY